MSEHRYLPAYRSYIVRVWSSQTGLPSPVPWRVQLVDVRTGISKTFTDPIKLAAFFYAEELLEFEVEEVAQIDEATEADDANESDQIDDIDEM
ncbi:MAG: hypothetical protein AAF702_48045 [Chloroflexota bacterium]